MNFCSGVGHYLWRQLRQAPGTPSSWLHLWKKEINKTDYVSHFQMCKTPCSEWAVKSYFKVTWSLTLSFRPSVSVDLAWQTSAGPIQSPHYIYKPPVRADGNSKSRSRCHVVRAVTLASCSLHHVTWYTDWDWSGITETCKPLALKWPHDCKSLTSTGRGHISQNDLRWSKNSWDTEHNS